MSVTYSTFGGRIISENRGGVIRDYVSDPLGNTVALVDDTGAITDRWEYWPYGEVAARTGTNVTPFTFIGALGYFKDTLTRLYIRARHLRVDLTQWLTQDPLWPREQAFRYVGSRPNQFVDPSGKDACDIAFGLCVAAVAIGLAVCLAKASGAEAVCIAACQLSIEVPPLYLACLAACAAVYHAAVVACGVGALLATIACGAIWLLCKGLLHKDPTNGGVGS